MSPNASSRRPARPAASAGRKPVKAGAAPPSKRLPLALIIGVALAIGLVTVIVVTMGSEPDEGETELAACVALRLQEGYSADEADTICNTVEVGTPTVTGDGLPAFDPESEDDAVGRTIPEVSGADLTGNPVAITRDGRPKVLMFFAHWCGVCREEVPAIVDWLPGATLPESVDLISVSTGVRRDQVNYPPSRWFATEGWTVPFIADDAAGSVAQAFGLRYYPYFIFVDAEGKVVERLVGAVPVATIEAKITELAGA